MQGENPNVTTVNPADYVDQQYFIGQADVVMAFLHNDQVLTALPVAKAVLDDYYVRRLLPGTETSPEFRRALAQLETFVKHW